MISLRDRLLLGVCLLLCASLGASASPTGHIPTSHGPQAHAPRHAVPSGYWIDSANGTDTATCGKSIGSPCQTYYYWLNSGCSPASGCKNDGIPHSGGDTVYFRAGTYHGDDNPTAGSRTYIAIPWDGTATDPVTYACYDTPGTCVVDLDGVTGLGAGSGMMAVGAAINVKTNSADAAAYITIRGFKFAPVSGTGVRSAIVDIGNASTHHILVDQVSIDPTTLANFLGYSMRFSTTAAYTTVKHSSALATLAADKGGPSFDRSPNMALVGNDLGAANDTTNNDCHNLLGIVVGLSDSNVCRDNADGLDSGQNADTPALDRLVIRYNLIRNIGGNVAGSRCIPMSGNGATGLIGQNAIYKNLCYQTQAETNASGIVNYGSSQKTSIWYNTVFLAGVPEFRLYTVSGQNVINKRQTIRHNIFDTVATSGDVVALYSDGAATACPSGDHCPLVGNDFYSPEHSSATCVTWQPSDTGATTYTCAQTATTFNSINSNSGNQNTNPVFAARAGDGFTAAASDLRLQASSPLIDQGAPFCRTVGAGSGATTLTVTCQGATNDPRYFFPQPGDYYGVTNADCVGYGARAVDGVAAGCFDIQIEGCGIRQVVSETSSTITIDNACAWADGAMVHVPWNGAGPDLGALEAANGATTTTSSVTTTSSTTSTSTSSSTTTSTSTSVTTTTSTSSTTTTLAATIQVLTVGAPTAQSNSATSYMPISGTAATPGATEALMESIMAAPGTVGGLRALVGTVPGGSATWALTLMLNGSPSALTCTITAAATTCQDGSNGHNVTVAAGDRAYWKIVPSGTPASSPMRISVLWKPTTSDQTVWPVTTSGSVASANGFFNFFSGTNATTDNTASRIVVPIPGTLSNLYTWCTNAVAASATRVWTVNQNGAGSALTCTQTAGSTTCNDTNGGHAVSLAAGDVVNLAYTFTGTPGSSGCAMGAVFVPSTSGLYMVGGLGTTATTPTTATDVYAALSHQQFGLTSTRDGLVQRITQASTMKNIYVLLDGATGASSTLDVTLESGASSTALTCSMTNGSTCNLTTDVTVADDALLNTLFHHSGSAGTSRRANVSYSALFTGTFP